MDFIMEHQVFFGVSFSVGVWCLIALFVKKMDDFFPDEPIQEGRVEKVSTCSSPALPLIILIFLGLVGICAIIRGLISLGVNPGGL